MKLFFLLLQIGISIPATAQNNSGSWNKVMNGLIGKYPATMYIQKTGKTFNGYYYYDSKQIPVRLMDMDSKPDSVHLAAIENNMDEYLDGVFNGASFKGIWKNTKDGKTTSFEFDFTENDKSAGPGFDIVYTEGSAEYPAGLGKGNNPSYSYFSAALWPVPTTTVALSNFLKKWVNMRYERKNTTDAIGNFFVNQKNTSIASWKKELNATKKSEIKEFPSGFSYSIDRRLLLVYQSEKYISIADCSYEFTGGAHGNGGTSMKVLDLKKQKELKLGDVFTTAGKQKLTALLDVAVRAKFNIPKGKKLNADDGGALLVDKIEPTENFYITGKGVGFNYTPYEIAAYAFGETVLFLPFDQLKGLLQPGFQ